MKCHILFSGKNKKNISKCHLLKILPRVLSVKKKKKSTNEKKSMQNYPACKELKGSSFIFSFIYDLLLLHPFQYRTILIYRFDANDPHGLMCP